MSETLPERLGKQPLWIKVILVVGAFIVAYYGSYYFFQIFG